MTNPEKDNDPSAQERIIEDNVEVEILKPPFSVDKELKQD